MGIKVLYLKKLYCIVFNSLLFENYILNFILQVYCMDFHASDMNGFYIKY